MVVISFFILAVPVACVTYWLGRGVRLNQYNRAAMVAVENPDIDPDALIDLRTGEIIDPGTRKHSRAVQTSKVVFE